MSQLLVITFDKRETAGQAAERLKGVQGAHQVSINDMAVVEKDDDGKVHVHHGMDTVTAGGAAVGGVLGLLLGIVFFPIAGLAIGAVAGGLIGGLTDAGISETHAEYYAEAVRRGGALVTVRADDGRADEAEAIIRRHGAFDIEDRATQWKSTGWTGYNPEAEPYTFDEIERERTQWRATGAGTARP